MSMRELIIYGQGDPIISNRNAFFSIIIGHDPQEDGALFRFLNWTKFPILLKVSKWLSNPVRIGIISILIFGILGIWSSTSGTFFSGIPPTQFQVTPTVQTIFASEPASTGENGVFIFLLFSVELSLLLFFLKKLIPNNKNLRVVVYFVLALTLMSLFLGAQWMSYHYLRYGTDDAKLLATFIFGSLGAFLTVFFGTFIPFYVWHFTNNAFLKISEIITINESVVVLTGLLYFLLLILWISIEVIIFVIKKKIKKRREPQFYAESTNF
jgi:hypothetical protein